LSRACIFGLSCILAGCLPEDTRPPPGRLDVRVAADDAVLSGFSTADGWRIEFDGFLMALGEVELDGDDCSAYNETDYLRLVNLRVAGPQTLSTAYALGACELDFRVDTPADDVVLGTGVTPADVARFRTAGSDSFAQDSGVVVWVAGRAHKGAIEKSFDWAFRRGVQYERCGETAGSQLSLKSDDAQAVELVVGGKTLFADGLELEAAELAFAPFAAADDQGDGDGRVTLAELERAPLGRHRSGYETHAALLYLGLVPRLPIPGGAGACERGPIEADDFP
jgi:hypothetical protein